MTKQRLSLHHQYKMFAEASRISQNKLREAATVKDSTYWLDLFRSNVTMRIKTLHKICSDNANL